MNWDRSIITKWFRYMGNRRAGLYVYLFMIIISALVIIIFYWIPSPSPLSIQQTTVPFQGGNKTTQTKSSTNTTLKEVTTTATLSFPNGTDKFILEKKVSSPNNNPIDMFKARFENTEVMLLALSSLFGLLGASIAGITSLYKQKFWDRALLLQSWLNEGHIDI
jgi:ABC-type dipeptide/oligopeptide/nickel transport system permease component